MLQVLQSKKNRIFELCNSRNRHNNRNMSNDRNSSTPATKAVAARLPMENYLELQAEAVKLKMSMNELIIYKLFNSKPPAPNDAEPDPIEDGAGWGFEHPTWIECVEDLVKVICYLRYREDSTEEIGEDYRGYAAEYSLIPVKQKLEDVSTRPAEILAQRLDRLERLSWRLSEL